MSCAQQVVRHQWRGISRDNRHTRLLASYFDLKKSRRVEG
jgi:hypothetical protein